MSDKAFVFVSISIANSEYKYNQPALIEVQQEMSVELDAADLIMMLEGIKHAMNNRAYIAAVDFVTKLEEANKAAENEE